MPSAPHLGLAKREIAVMLPAPALDRVIQLATERQTSLAATVRWLTIAGLEAEDADRAKGDA